VELAILAKGTQGAPGSDGDFRTCQGARLNKASRVSGERADNHGDCRHLTRAMLEHYSHIRLAAKRTTLEGIVVQAGAGVNQNVNQQPQTEIAPPTI
jgi:hypothetical protein